MTDTHTPGPWLIEGSPTIEEGRQVAAFSEDGNRVLQVVVRSFRLAEDTRLIAAAPELLEACRSAEWNSLDLPESTRDKLRAAIAKATGGAD